MALFDTKDDGFATASPESAKFYNSLELSKTCNCCEHVININGVLHCNRLNHRKPFGKQKEVFIIPGGPPRYCFFWKEK